MILSHPLSAA